MSKLKPDKINFDNDDFVVEISDENNFEKSFSGLISNGFDDKKEADLNCDTVSECKPENIEKSNSEADIIIEKANEEKDKILEEANTQAEQIINNANEEAKRIIDEANKQSLELLENSKTELEQQITASATEGYQAGYNDGLEKVKEELTEKLENFEKFCNVQSEIRNKILKSASKDIINIIENISRKILLNIPDKASIEKIIENTIMLLEKKEDITIILSEKYAKILFDIQNNSLADESEMDFEKFKQYKGFNVIFNQKFDDDTIIVETPLERYDASINLQLDIIIRDILEGTQNGKIDDIEQFENET